MAQTIEELAEILDNFKNESEKNAQNFDKFLVGITNKLNEIAEDDNAEELAKVYMSELKNLILERKSAVTAEFEKIQNAFDNINSQQSFLAKSDEINNLSENFAKGVESLSKSLEQQRNLFEQYDKKFSDYSGDKTDKNEIIDTISAVKQNLESINNRFSLTANDIGSDIQTILKNLVVMDPTAQNDIVKRELENIYISTNSILTAIHSVEQKNDDIIQNIKNYITKENYEQSQEKLDSINRKSDEIALRLSFIPTKDEIAVLDEKINEIDFGENLTTLLNMTEDVRATLEKTAEKDDLTSVIYQINDMSEKFEKLSGKNGLDAVFEKASLIHEQLSAVSQKDDLNGIYKSLEEFALLLNNLGTNLTHSNENIITEFKVKFDNFQNVLNSIVNENDFVNFKTELNDFIGQTLAKFSQISDDLNVHRATIGSLTEKISSSNISKNLEILNDKLNRLSEKLEDDNEIKEKIETLAYNIKDIEDELERRHSQIVNQLLEDDNEKYENNQRELLSIESSIEKLRNIIIFHIERIINELSGIYQAARFPKEEFQEQADSILAALNNVTDEISRIKDNQGTLLAKLSDENIQNLAETIENFKNTSLDNANIITGEINRVADNLQDYSRNEIQTKLDNFNGIVAETTDKLNQILELQNTIAYKLSANDDSSFADNIQSDIRRIESLILEFKMSAESNRDKILEQLSMLTVKADDSESRFISVSENIEFLKDSIVSMCGADDENITENLIALRELINENSHEKSEILNYLKDKIDEYIYNSNEISKTSDEKLNESLTEISNLKTDIQEIIRHVEQWSADFQENNSMQIMNQIVSSLENIVLTMNSLQNNVQNRVHQELSDTTMTLEQRMSDLSMYLDSLKTEFSDNQMQNEEFIKELKDRITAVVQEINLVNTDIVDALNTQSQSIIAELKTVKEIIEEFTSQNDSENTVQNFIGENYEKIEKLLKVIYQKIDNELISLNEIGETYTNTLSEFEEKISDNIDSAKDELISIIGEKANDFTNLMSLMSSSDENIEQFFDGVKEYSAENCKKLTELLNVLNQKVDILAMSEESTELIDEIDEIKGLFESQKEFFKNEIENNKSEEIEIKLTELIGKIDEFQSLRDTEKSDLVDMKETLLSTIINVFEQISFIEETEDIKDFVEEKTDEINKNISDVKRQLDSMTNTDSDYSYTLQDVETDIAKLRVVLNEMSKNSLNESSNDDLSEISDNIQKIITTVKNLETSLTQEQMIDLKSDFEKLNEDIVSISTRTNKLLLNSDESYNALNSGLNDFTNLINSLQEQLDNLDNKDITERIEHKVNELCNSNKLIRQAMMYMGEWIDSTSEKINNLQQNTNIICEQNPNVLDLLKTNNQLLEEMKSSIVCQDKFVEILNSKFAENQGQMDRIEMKLEKILKAIDEIDDTKVIKKIDKLDRQISKSTKNIEKLTSYVE